MSETSSTEQSSLINAARPAARVGTQGTVAASLLGVIIETLHWHPSAALYGYLIVLITAGLNFLQNHLENIGAIKALFYPGGVKPSASQVVTTVNTSPPVDVEAAVQKAIKSAARDATLRKATAKRVPAKRKPDKD